MARDVLQDPRTSISLYNGGEALSRVIRKNWLKPRLVVQVAFGILLLLLFCWATYGPDKHELTKHARTEWSKKCRQVCLDGVPEQAKYWGGAYDGYWASGWIFTRCTSGFPDLSHCVLPRSGPSEVRRRIYSMRPLLTRHAL
jgi:hypothetical protein